jgi:hypothetical protein
MRIGGTKRRRCRRDDESELPRAAGPGGKALAKPAEAADDDADRDHDDAGEAEVAAPQGACEHAEGEARYDDEGGADPETVDHEPLLAVAEIALRHRGHPDRTRRKSSVTARRATD